MKPIAFWILISLACQGEKLRTPTGVETKLAEKKVKEIFSVEYEMRERDDRLVFAYKLLEAASSGKDEPSIRWVLLRDSLTFASECLDLEGAFLAAEKAAEVFNVKVEELNDLAFTTAKKSVRTLTDASDLSDSCVRIAFHAMKSEDFDGAIKWAKEAEKLARSGRNPSALERANGVAEVAATAKKERKDAQEALTRLSLSEDSEARLILGKYLCFTKNEWKDGIAHLSKCSDEGLRRAALGELQNPTTTDDLAKVGDFWWSLSSQKGKGKVEQACCRERAKHWYEFALKEAAGLLKAQIERRLAEVSEEHPLNGINLLKFVDPKKAVCGEWTLSERGLVSPSPVGGVAHRIEIDYNPGTEYDLTLEVEPKPGGNFLIGLVCGGRNQTFVAVYDSVCGLCVLDGKHYSDNETTTRGQLLENGKTTRISCSVRRTGVTVKFDGKKVIDWKGDFKRFTQTDTWKVTSNKSLFLGSGGAFQFSRVVLTPLTSDSGPLK